MHTVHDSSLYLCDELGFDAHEYSMLFSIFTRQFLIIIRLSFPRDQGKDLCSFQCYTIVQLIAISRD